MKKPDRSTRRFNLPRVLEVEGTSIALQNQKIPHREILLAISKSCDFPGGLVGIYRQKVLANQTRTIRLLGTKCSAKIIHTLLGYEVQAQYKRIHCPDLVTARYLKLFSEIGCRSIRLPYDPTVTEELIPKLETAVDVLHEKIKNLFQQDRELQRYVMRKIYAIIRQQLRIT